jgi:predicted TPR repeat methyltransferase
MNINNNERLNLKKLIDEMDCEDNTDNIRKLKHSVLIRNDIRKIENLKTKNSELKISNPEEFESLCQVECQFLFNNYTDIFNKLLKDELDLTIMTKLLTVLKMIEDGKVDQHEGSVLVGKILKELYIDSAVKRADNIDKEYESMKLAPNEGKKISWQEFKNMNK